MTYKRYHFGLHTIALIGIKKNNNNNDVLTTKGVLYHNRRDFFLYISRRD